MIMSDQTITKMLEEKSLIIEPLEKAQISRPAWIYVWEIRSASLKTRPRGS